MWRWLMGLMMLFGIAAAGCAVVMVMDRNEGQVAIMDPEQGPVVVEVPSDLASRVSEMSGLARWTPGNVAEAVPTPDPSRARYLAVSDDSTALIVLDIEQRADGHVTAAGVRTVLPTQFPEADRRSTDLEGLAAGGGLLMAADESNGALLALTVTPAFERRILEAADDTTSKETTATEPGTSDDSRSAGSPAPPAPPAPLYWDSTASVIPEGITMRPNQGIESLCYDPSRGGWWTMNESAFVQDGPAATESEGTMVRLMFRPARAGDARPSLWYRTDPIPGMTPLHDRETSGVAGMAALPDGRLLVLERAVGRVIRLSLHLIDPSESLTAEEPNDADSSTAPGIALTRQTLWVRDTMDFRENYEGIALGPRQADGSLTVLLVSDNAGKTEHLVYGLRLELE